ncbi:MAG: hypothetical protein IJ905_12665 [Fibrobacter sp.]|nr:hypothetical protein [Fibrobacter sp.]
MPYIIQCYIETLSSTSKKSFLTVRGCDGYRFEKDGKKYSVFVDLSNENNKMHEEQEDLTINNSTKNDFILALQAYLNHKKVELELDADCKTITKISLL